MEPSEFDAFMRVDIVYREAAEPKLVEINLNAKSQLDSEKVALGRLEISLEAMVWNGIEIRTDLEQINRLALRNWYMSAMDLEDSNPVGEDNLSGVIHSFGTYQEDGYVSFAVDFGSAPASTLVDLLSILEKEGANEISIGSWAFVP